MSDRARTDEQFLDLPADDAVAGEHIDNQVQRAQEQLLALKRQQDVIERQKRELEELGRRQDQLQQGRAEMMEKFTRSLVVLERENYDAQKRVETLHAVHDAFSQHLDLLDALNPKAWEGLDLNKELTKALSTVDDARAEYARSLPKVSRAPEAAGGGSGSVTGPADYVAGETRDFTYWLKAGFAFTLPLFTVGLLLVIVLVAVFHR